MEMSEQQKLAQAQQLLQQNRFDEARTILQSMPNNPTAQQWLNYLNQSQPQQTPAPATPPPPNYGGPAPTPPPAYAGSYTPPPPRRISADQDLPLWFRQPIRMATGGVSAILAVAVVVMFFVLPIINVENFGYFTETQEALEYESENAEDDYERDLAKESLEQFNNTLEGKITYEEDVYDEYGYWDGTRTRTQDVGIGVNDLDFTAWQIWTGNSGLEINEPGAEWDGSFTLSGDAVETYVLEPELDSDGNLDLNEFGGFSEVRMLDRILIFLLIGALAVIVLSGLYAFQILKPLPGMASIFVIYLLMFGLMFLWQSASTSEWRGNIDDQINKTLEEGAYDADLSTRVALRVGSGDALEIGEDYVERMYNTTPLKLLLGLATLAMGTVAFLTYQTQISTPGLAEKLRQSRSTPQPFYGGGADPTPPAYNPAQPPYQQPPQPPQYPPQR